MCKLVPNMQSWAGGEQQCAKEQVMRSDCIWTAGERMDVGMEERNTKKNGMEVFLLMAV